MKNIVHGCRGFVLVDYCGLTTFFFKCNSTCRISYSSFFRILVNNPAVWEPSDFEVPPVNAESDVFSVKCLLRPECLFAARPRQKENMNSSKF